LQWCWFSLDEYDDDPNRFWQYVVAALQTACPGNMGQRKSDHDSPA
jgi:LuxR family maltose regulon positive regulatory protein